MLGQQPGRIRPQPSGGTDDGGDMMVIDQGRPHPVEPRTTGQLVTATPT
jgi:hypothetical protein